MKKTKFIALALVLCLALMGSAFAYWNQTANINGLVSTGNLKVEIKPISSNPGIWFYKNDSEGNAYEQCFIGLQEYAESEDIEGFPDVSIDDYNIGAEMKQTKDEQEKDLSDSIDLVMTNACPGTGVCYAFSINNTGTVPVKVNSVKVKLESKNGEIKKCDINKIQFRFSYYVVDDKGKLVGKGYNWNNVANFNDLENAILNDIKNVVLCPGQKIYFGTPKTINTGSGDELVNDLTGKYTNGLEMFIPHEWTNRTQSSNFTYSIKFNYTQANDFSIK